MLRRRLGETACETACGESSSSGILRTSVRNPPSLRRVALRSSDRFQPRWASLAAAYQPGCLLLRASCRLPQRGGSSAVWALQLTPVETGRAKRQTAPCPGSSTGSCKTSEPLREPSAPAPPPSSHLSTSTRPRPWTTSITARARTSALPPAHLPRPRPWCPP